MLVETTATHRFVILALHVAHQGDDELQAEEQDALAAAAHALGIAAGVSPDQVQQMVRDAARAYEAAVAEGRVDREVRDAMMSLGIFKSEIRRSVLLHLRGVAKAHGGVNVDEHELLTSLRDAWDVDLTAKS